MRAAPEKSAAAGARSAQAAAGLMDAGTAAGRAADPGRADADGAGAK